ncbi:MAG TPA: DUF4249 family protein [Bacteroidales bacterium]|nr:DUF4249 family protein [Bacteroidales bacterium]
MNLKINIFHIAFCIIILLSVLLITGCVISDKIDIDIPEQSENLVIEGYLTPDNPMEITLIKNNLMDNELILQSIWNAKAYITDRKDTIDLLNIFYSNKKRNILVNYRADSLPRVLAGNVLYLSVITKGNDTLTGSAPVLSPIKIENAVIEDNYLHLSQSITGGGFSGYLRVDMSAFRADSIYYKSSKTLDLSDSKSLNIKLQVSDEIQESDSLLVRTFHISKDYYSYIVSLNDAINAYFDPFLTPEEIKSNIRNGIGIFTYYTKADTVIIF